MKAPKDSTIKKMDILKELKDVLCLYPEKKDVVIERILKLSGSYNIFQRIIIENFFFDITGLKELTERIDSEIEKLKDKDLWYVLEKRKSDSKRDLIIELLKENLKKETSLTYIVKNIARRDLFVTFNDEILSIISNTEVKNKTEAKALLTLSASKEITPEVLNAVNEKIISSSQKQDAHSMAMWIDILDGTERFKLIKALNELLSSKHIHEIYDIYKQVRCDYPKVKEIVLCWLEVKMENMSSEFIPHAMIVWESDDELMEVLISSYKVVLRKEIESKKD